MTKTQPVLDPAARTFPEFSLSRLLQTVFEPTQGMRVCILIDLEDPNGVNDFAFLSDDKLPVQKYAYEVFYQGLKNGVMEELGMRGGEFFAYPISGGSNLNLQDRAVRSDGQEVSLEKDVYTNYDIILCISTFSATAPLTAFAKQYGFRGATLHGLNDIIIKSGLSVNYREVSADAEKLRLAMTKADEIEIDFTIADTHKMTCKLYLEGQEAQKSHGLCLGTKPDIANLPAGEVYFVPTSAEGQFPLKYEDGSLGILDLEKGRITKTTLVEGNQATIDEHNAMLEADPMTGVLGELGFGTQVLPVSGADIQDEKILGTCHLATGRDDHLGGHITPELFKQHQNATHDDILFAPHKTPNFDIAQVRMKRGDQEEVLIEHFKPMPYLVDALSATE